MTTCWSLDPVTYQPQSQFGIGFEDQGIFWKKPTFSGFALSGLGKLNQASKITVSHERINYFDGT